MNDETVSLIERSYQEIVDDILTAIVGGVVNEPIFYDVKEDLYPLAQPARDVRGIRGTRTTPGTGKPASYAFLKEVDFVFSAPDNAVIWQDGSAHPDDETIFYVDYFRRESRSPLSDINVGSVTRTLSEAIGREIATVYEQINQAYRAGFVDTAEGKSLDFVVSILGITRRTKEFAQGFVTFFRDTAAADGNIAIPEGTLLATSKGEASFVATELRTLQRGQVRIDVPVRASDASRGAAGKVNADTITSLAQPIAGIARVSNPEATFLGAEDESDTQLRARAKAALRGMGKATLLALYRVIFEGRAKLTEVWDPNGPATRRSEPGKVVLLVECEPERFAGLRASVEETRAAGIHAALVARYVFFKPRVKAKVTGGMDAAGQEKVKAQMREALQRYVDSLGAGDAADGHELLKALKGVKDVSEPTMADVMAWKSDLGESNGDALVDALASAVQAGGTEDQLALKAALARVLTESAPTAPTGRRIPDRGLVVGPTGQKATDAEMEAGTFKVSATVNGEKWWVVLDIDPADIDFI